MRLMAGSMSENVLVIFAACLIAPASAHPATADWTNCSGATQIITIAQGDPGSEGLSKTEAVIVTPYKRRSKTDTLADVLWPRDMRTQR